MLARCGALRLGQETDLAHGVTEHAAPGPGGDPPDFESSFAAHQEDVARVCRRILGGREEARDAPQEIFLRARRAFAGYDPERPFRPWLLAIAGNYCIDQLRRQATAQRIFVDLDPAEAVPATDAGASALGRLVAREERQVVSQAIAKLPLEYRLPLVLRYFSDLDYRAIAEALDVSTNQVGTLLFRAKQRLRKAVEESSDHPGRPASRKRRR
jgi:RNA polymerase sigma-70 factor (ECF subfamily)